MARFAPRPSDGTIFADLVGNGETVLDEAKQLVVKWLGDDSTRSITFVIIFYDNEEHCETARITALISPTTDLHALRRDLDRARKGYITGAIGSDPKPELSAAELASDAAIEAAKQAAELELLNKRIAELADIPGVTFSDETLWRNFCAGSIGDRASETVARCARRFMSYVERYIDDDDTVADLWESFFLRISDNEGLSDGMEDAVASVVASCWSRGAEFKRLYEAKNHVTLRQLTIEPKKP
jgi:hypothetical protein